MQTNLVRILHSCIAFAFAGGDPERGLLPPCMNICALCVSLASFAFVFALDLEHISTSCICPVKTVGYRQPMPRPLNSPRPPRYDAAKAVSDLSSADPKLGKLIERAGPFTMRAASAQSPFEALVESI